MFGRMEVCGCSETREAGRPDFPGREGSLLGVLLVLIYLGCAEGAGQQDLLSFLLAQNQAAREKMQTFSYRIELEGMEAMDDGPHGYTAVGDVKRKGDYQWSTYRRSGLNAGAPAVRESRVVVNDKYVACWPMAGNPIAYQDDHSSLDTMSEKMKARVAVNTPPCFLPSCFGETVRPFSESITVHPEDTHWDAVETHDPEGRTVYHIRRFMPTMADASQPDMIWVIDPQKGFLATETISYKPDGKVWIHRTMGVEEAAPGVWFPVQYEEQHYGVTRDPQAAHALSASLKAVLRDVRVNEPMSDEQFEISALGLQQDRPDIIVLRTGLDGERTPYVYQEEGLIPKRMADGVEFVADRALGRGIGTENQEAPASRIKSGAETDKATAGHVRAAKGPPATRPREAVRHSLAVVSLSILLGLLAVVGVMVYLPRNPRET
jgi:hypothetical protein